MNVLKNIAWVIGWGLVFALATTLFCITLYWLGVAFVSANHVVTGLICSSSYGPCIPVVGVLHFFTWLGFFLGVVFGISNSD